MTNPLDAMLCYCTGDTVGDVCRIAAQRKSRTPSIGNYCTGCRDDFRFVCRLVQENPECWENDQRLAELLARARGSARPRRS